EEILRGRGFPAEPKQIVEVESRSLATPGQVSGSFVGRFLTFFLFMLMLSGGSVVAMDSIAGEKERGSLETLLTTAARRAESVAVREVMVGKYDWPMIALTFLVMALTSFGIARASTRMLSKERLITASESDVADLEGGASLFSKHVLRWYALLWAVMFAVAANIPQLATFRRQLLFNEIVIFLGAPALMIWKYRLNWRDALALRGVNPMVWLGALLSI